MSRGPGTHQREILERLARTAPGPLVPGYEMLPAELQHGDHLAGELPYRRLPGPNLYRAVSGLLRLGLVRLRQVRSPRSELFSLVRLTPAGLGYVSRRRHDVVGDSLTLEQLEADDAAMETAHARRNSESEASWQHALVNEVSPAALARAIRAVDDMQRGELEQLALFVQMRLAAVSANGDSTDPTGDHA